MATHTGKETRTISGYAAQLLEYPRSVIECDCDFTSCPYEGRFNPFIAECIDCRFAGACRWFNQHHLMSIEDAKLDELIAALQAAVDYLSQVASHEPEYHCEDHSWLKEARSFLRSTSSKHHDCA
jgi:hypothetical protein